MNELDSMVHLRFRRLLDLYNIDYSESGEDEIDGKLMDILEQMHLKIKSQRFDINVLAIAGAALIGPVIGYLLAKGF